MERAIARPPFNHLIANQQPMSDPSHVLDVAVSWLPSSDGTLFWLFAIVMGFGISKLSTALTKLVMGEDDNEDVEGEDTPN